MPIAVMIEFEREYQIDDDYLYYHPEESRSGLRGLARFIASLHLAVYFMGRLSDQEQPTADQNDVAPGKRQAVKGEDSSRESDQPHQQAEQQDTEHQRKRQSDLARTPGLCRRDTGHDDGQKDDVVDAKNDLERRQRQQRRPRFRTRQKFDHALSDLTNRIAASQPTM